MGFLKSDNVMLGQHADSKDEALWDVARKAVQLGVTDDAAAVHQSFIDREALGETGMTEGFAIPHAKCNEIRRATVIVYKNDHAVEWPSFDGKPVDIAIALLVPNSQAGTTHLKLLSKTAVLIMDDDFKRLVRDANDVEGIVNAINTELEKE